jgi:4-amino-4-deoxy-L-arabinose transferase-like glycosyltransferase
LEVSRTILEDQIEGSASPATRAGSLEPIRGPVQHALYAICLAVSISIWFFAIRAPLWLDETISFWQIHAGFWRISSRQGLSFPAYSYILWLWTKATGTGTITLRVSSILAMLGAVYLLYRTARELFDRDVAIIAAVVFCLHPVVVFESIDVRSYAFAALAITSSTFALVCLRHNISNWLAALFGLSAACIVYFHLLFVVILPALAICFLTLIADDRKTFWRRLSVALVAFSLAFLPVIPNIQYMFHTSATHVFAEAPKLADLRSTLALGKWPSFLLAGTVLVAAATRRLDLKRHLEGWPVLFCTSLALVPILILYGVSVGTSIHVFLFRYKVVAIPGIALCWALVVSRIESRALRLLLCMAIVAAVAYHDHSSPYSRLHGYTWKYALESVEKNASTDDAPVLICSDLPESDYMPMPTSTAVKDSGLFAPLTYYKLNVPVVPLPRALNDDAVRIGSQFLQEAAKRHKRFLALAFFPSYGSLDWIAENAGGTHYVHELGVFDGIKVLEFIPRTRPDAPR